MIYELYREHQTTADGEMVLLQLWEDPALDQQLWFWLQGEMDTQEWLLTAPLPCFIFLPFSKNIDLSSV